MKYVIALPAALIGLFIAANVALAQEVVPASVGDTEETIIGEPMTETAPSRVVFLSIVSRSEVQTTAPAPTPVVTPAPTPKPVDPMAAYKACIKGTLVGAPECVPVKQLRDAWSAFTGGQTITISVYSRNNGAALGFKAWIDDANRTLWPDHECEIGYAVTFYDVPRKADPDVPAGTWFSKCSHVWDDSTVMQLPTDRYMLTHEAGEGLVTPPGVPNVAILIAGLGRTMHEDGSW